MIGHKYIINSVNTENKINREEKTKRNATDFGKVGVIQRKWFRTRKGHVGYFHKQSGMDESHHP